MVLGMMFGFELPPLALLALVLVVVLMVSSWARTPANLPPCPARPYPILGHLVHMAKGPDKVIMDWSKQTGEIFSLYFGTSLVVVLSSYDILKETLVKQGDIFSDKPKHGFIPVLKTVNGIGETSGPLWKENRTTVLASLREFGMGKNIMAEKIEEEVHAYLDEIEKLEGKPTDLKDLNIRAASNVICNFLLGKRFEYGDTYFKKLLKIFDDMIEATAAGAVHLWFPIVQYLPGDFFKAKLLVREEEVFQAFARDLIKTMDNDEAAGYNKNNIIAHYLQEMREKREKGLPTLLSEEGLTKTTKDLMMAGSESTTTTLCWFNIYMIHHPDVLKKIHEEIDEVIGRDRNPRISDRPKMVYLSATIMEIQRVSNIVPLGIFHRCNQETTVRGYTIPKDTYIMPHLDAVLLSEKIWGDPHRFRPERFIDSQGNLLIPAEFIPFSLGRRLCLGESMAKAELFLFVSHIFQRYTVAPESPDRLPSFDTVLGLTRAPVPHKVRLIKRGAEEPQNKQKDTEKISHDINCCDTAETNLTVIALGD